METKIREGKEFIYEHEGCTYKCEVFSNRWNLTGNWLSTNESFYLIIKKMTPKKFLWIKYSGVEWKHKFCFKQNIHNEAWEFKLKYDKLDDGKWYKVEDITKHIPRAIKDYFQDLEIKNKNKKKYIHPEKI